MPRLNDSDFLSAHHWLRQCWLHDIGTYAQVLERNQVELHLFFSPSKDWPDEKLLEHRWIMTKDDPSLPQRAGRALQRFKQARASDVVYVPPVYEFPRARSTTQSCHLGARSAHTRARSPQACPRDHADGGARAARQRPGCLTPMSVPSRDAGSHEHVSNDSVLSAKVPANLGQRPAFEIALDSFSALFGGEGLVADLDTMFTQQPKHGALAEVVSDHEIAGGRAGFVVGQQLGHRFEAKALLSVMDHWDGLIWP